MANDHSPKKAITFYPFFNSEFIYFQFICFVLFRYWLGKDCAVAHDLAQGFVGAHGHDAGVGVAAAADLHALTFIASAAPQTPPLFHNPPNRSPPCLATAQRASNGLCVARLAHLFLLGRVGQVLGQRRHGQQGQQAESEPGGGLHSRLWGCEGRVVGCVVPSGWCVSWV